MNEQGKKKLKFNRQELINAFNAWNKDYLKEPDEFQDITSETLASDQADLLIDYLKECQGI